MTYEIRIERSVSKQLAKYDKRTSARIYAQIWRLADNPRPSGVKKLVGRSDWRIRAGEYRVMYEINDRIVTVIVVKVSHRKDAYR